MGDDLSAPVSVPTLQDLEELRTHGIEVGYRGIHIYLRYQAILSSVAGRRFGSALCIGCGYGIFDRLLPTDLKFLGIDTGVAEIEFATAWASKKRPGFKYLRGSLLDLHLPPESFDLVIASEVLEHIEEELVVATIRESLRILCRGGMLLITVPNHWHLRNRCRALIGKETLWMDPAHLREYSLSEAKDLLVGYEVRQMSFRAAGLFFPKERIVARFLPAQSWIRKFIVSQLPTTASHFLLLAKKL